MDDYATLKSGYWWSWRNKTHKLLYENFTMNVANITFVVRTDSSRNDTLNEYPYVLPKPHKCPRKDSCKGGLDSKCSDGYEGPLCEVCSAGYYKQLQTCKQCPTKTWMAGQLSITAAVIAIIIALVVWASKRKSKKSSGRPLVDIILGRLKIVIGFYQVMFGVLETFAYIKWPESLTLIGKYSEMLQLNVLQIAPIHCLIPAIKVDAFGSLFAILAINAAAIIISVVIYGLRKLFLMRSSLDETEMVVKASQAKELIDRNLFFVLYVTYLSTCSKTANVLPLACRELCEEENVKDCQKFLKADYSIICHGPEYNRSVVVAYCAVIYIVILPTASMIALWKQRKVFNKSQAENEPSDAQEESTEVVKGLRFLFENYNPHSWYWELVETVRKVVLTSGLILVGGESRAYVGLACVLSGLYGMFFAYVHPIANPFENKLMLTSLAVTFVNLGIGAVSKIPKENIPASIDPYVDSIMFKIFVIAANSLVITLLIGKYCGFEIFEKVICVCGKTNTLLCLGEGFIICQCTGPAQQDFDWGGGGGGGLNVSQLFFFFLGGGGGSGMLPLENLGFSYSQIPEGLSKIMLLKRRIDLQKIIAIYLRWPSSWRYLDLLHRADESQKGRNSCPCFIGSVPVGV